MDASLGASLVRDAVEYTALTRFVLNMSCGHCRSALCSPYRAETPCQMQPAPARTYVLNMSPLASITFYLCRFLYYCTHSRSIDCLPNRVRVRKAAFDFARAFDIMQFLIPVILLLPAAIAQSTAPQWGQCGGQGWKGATVCAAGSYCAVSNP